MCSFEGTILLLQDRGLVKWYDRGLQNLWWEFDSLIPNQLPQPNKLRYFRGIAQLVARLVRDEEAVGSNPAAPTKKCTLIR